MKNLSNKKYCEKLMEMSEFFENNKEQKLKYGSYYDVINNLNTSYLNHVYFEIYKEIYDKCKTT